MRNLRFVLSLLVLGVLVAFFAPVRDGGPMLTYAGVKGFVAGAFRGSPTEEGGTMYKWKSEDGSWHYSNVRPADHPEAQVVSGGDVSWAKGSGAPPPKAPASAGGEREEPRNAAELLAESKRLSEQAEGRESELEKRVREATQD